MKHRDLRDLAHLARLRADHSARELARVSKPLAELAQARAQLQVAGDGGGPDLAQAAMRDRWLRWRASELRRLSVVEARLQAAAQPKREAHARDRARYEVLQKLLRTR